MPIYEYRCDCGYREVISHGMHADIEVVCTYCEKVMPRRPQVASVQFKGTGWASRETR